MRVEFIVPGQPQGKARARTVTQNGRTHSYTPESTVQYENLVKLEWRGTHTESFGDKPISMTIEAVFQIPKGYTKAGKLLACSGRILPKVKPDADNIAKSVSDALCGEAFDDDKQVVELHIVKRYVIEREEPHVKVILCVPETGGN